MNIIKEIADRKYAVPANGLGNWLDISALTDILYDYCGSTIEKKVLLSNINQYTDDCIGYEDRFDCNQYVRTSNIVVLEVFEYYQFEVRFKQGWQWRFANV